MSKKVLIIDDEPGVIALVKDWLGSRGYDVISAKSGADGIRKAKDEEPDIIILDINMPVIDGFEVLDKLRNCTETQYTPIIMLTERRETESIVKATETGSTDYIMKPISMEKLLAIVKKYSWH